MRNDLRFPRKSIQNKLNRFLLTFPSTRPCVHTIELSSLQLKTWLVGKMMQSLTVVVSSAILQQDHWMISTLCVQHKLDVNSIHYLNNLSFHLGNRKRETKINYYYYYTFFFRSYYFHLSKFTRDIFFKKINSILISCLKFKRLVNFHIPAFLIFLHGNRFRKGFCYRKSNRCLTLQRISILIVFNFRKSFTLTLWKLWHMDEIGTYHGFKKDYFYVIFWRPTIFINT